MEYKNKISIAMVSDEIHPINQYVQNWLVNRGFEVTLFGALRTGKDESWVTSTFEAARAVADGSAQSGVFFCWSGTGASMTANKVKNIRAALCTDVDTVRLAKTWNHANVLVLSNRILTPELADEMLQAWFFEEFDAVIGTTGVKELDAVDNCN